MCPTDTINPPNADRTYSSSDASGTWDDSQIDSLTGWRGDTDDAAPHVTITLAEFKTVVGLVIQGRNGYAYFLTFSILNSKNTHMWPNYLPQNLTNTLAQKTNSEIRNFCGKKRI